jgi:hypothetical protein
LKNEERRTETEHLGDEILHLAQLIDHLDVIIQEGEQRSRLQSPAAFGITCDH